MEYDYYILFNTHTDGLMMVKKLKENNIRYTITPTPRQLSKCCGISIKYEHEDEKTILDIIDKYELKVLGLHPLERKKVDVKFI